MFARIIGWWCRTLTTSPEVDIQGRPRIPAQGDEALGAVTIEDLQELKEELK